MYLLNFILCFLSVKWSFLPDASSYRIISMKNPAALGFVRQEVLKKKRLQISETRETLKSQTLRPSSNRSAIILWKVGHPHFSKESNVKAGCQVAHMLPVAPLAGSAFWNSRAFVKSSTAFLQLNQWRKTFQKVFLPPNTSHYRTTTNTLWGKSSFFLMQYFEINYLSPKKRYSSMRNGNWQCRTPLQEHYAFCPFWLIWK